MQASPAAPLGHVGVEQQCVRCLRRTVGRRSGGACRGDLVDVGAANLDGNGELLNRTLTGFSQAVETLSEHRDDLFSSLDNLQTFTSALASIDAQVGEFNTNMAAVADLLAQERQDLAAAVQLLNQALSDVSGFVQDNTSLLTTNVNRLADVTLALVQQRQALAEVLDHPDERARLGANAAAHASRFSWSTTAAATLEAYGDALRTVRKNALRSGAWFERGR